MQITSVGDYQRRHCKAVPSPLWGGVGVGVYENEVQVIALAISEPYARVIRAAALSGYLAAFATPSDSTCLQNALSLPIMRLPTDPVANLVALIRCPSVTPEEGGALTALEDMLKPLGFSVERPLFSQDGTPSIENLYGRLSGNGPHLMFAGH